MEKKIILVVDDDRFIAGTVKAFMGVYFPDHEVVERHSCKEALSFALENIDAIQIAILDGKIFGELGSDIGVTLRAKGSTAFICMLSGSEVEKIIPDEKNIPLFDGIYEKGTSLTVLVAAAKEKLGL